MGGGPDRRCEICYIIEGDASKKTVHGGNVGRRNWQQTVEDVEQAIASLPSHGFSVMKTKGHLGTVCKLAKVAEDVSWKAKNGSTDATFTYQQFLSRVKVLDDKYGDAPTDPRHMNPAPPVPDTDDLEAGALVLAPKKSDGKGAKELDPKLFDATERALFDKSDLKEITAWRDKESMEELTEKQVRVAESKSRQQVLVAKAAALQIQREVCDLEYDTNGLKSKLGF